MKSLNYSLLIFGALALAACGQKNGSNSVGAENITSKYDINKYSVNKTVCNPLNGGSSSSEPEQGIQAHLWYLGANQTRYTDVESYMNHGTASNKDLFFSQLFVPTRLFTEGFPLQSGGSIADDSGNELIEYFSLRFDTVLHLGPNDVEGDYQLGMLSDDGTIWSLSTDESQDHLQVVLNDDGTHPTQMGCSSTTVHMTKDTRLAMRLDYYQGPRYHIALVPMWRNVNQCSTQETLCGHNGNSLFFDYNNNSKPMQAFNDLLSRGWVPLGVGNYSIPKAADYNPCTQGTVPVISDFFVAQDPETGGYVATWTTDIIATDQVLVTDEATGQQTLTVSSNLMNTSHLVPFTGLLPGHTYTVQGVSVSQDLGKAISDPLTVIVTQSN